MKAYISGRITGLELQEAEANFENASNLIESIGMVAVNPLVGADQSKTWEQHMVRDIEMLMGCDAILMLNDWHESRGARIEKYIAEERGMLILYQSNIEDENDIIKTIGEAITEVTGIPYRTLATIGKIQTQYFARMIFTRFLMDHQGIKISDVSRILNRNEQTIMRYLRNYENEFKVNKKFRLMANHIALKIFINKPVSQ